MQGRTQHGVSVTATATSIDSHPPICLFLRLVEHFQTVRSESFSFPQGEACPLMEERQPRKPSDHPIPSVLPHPFYARDFFEDLSVLFLSMSE